MKYILSLLLLFTMCFLKAQNVYPLHPSVGDTIDLNEKLDYSLFEKIDNNEFLFAVIKFEKEGFKLVHSITDTIDHMITYHEAATDLTQEEIINEQQKIQKINAYYKYLAEEENKPKQLEYKALEEKLPIRFEGPISEKMKKDARMKARLAEDQRRVNDFEMGLRPKELRLEFSR